MTQIERIDAYGRKRDRIRLFLSDGACLKIPEEEFLALGLQIGDELPEETLVRLKELAGASDIRGTAAEIMGRRAMSRRDLERKLQERGASTGEARDAAEWMESLGAVDDAEYAAMLVRHYGRQGYGAGWLREKLREKGVPRELWDAALEELPDNEEQILRFLEGKLRGGQPEEKEKKRLTDALLRRGYPWGDIRAAWNRLGAETDGWDE